MSAATLPMRDDGAVPRRLVREWLFRQTCRLAGLAVIVLAILLTAILVWQSRIALRAVGLSFLTESDWDPNNGKFGSQAFIFGTLATSFVAMALAVPFGIGGAAFLSEVAPGWLRRGGSFLIELLAAIPSVVYGFWGLYFLAPLVQKMFTGLGGPNTGGSGILSAGIVLAVMVLPYLAAVSFDVCRAVPSAQREASYALGATRWQTIWSVVLPFARPGIIGGCFLALGRALGETMAVTMLIGNRAEIQLSLFAVGDSIASVIANQLNEAQDKLLRSALVELGLVLLLVTVAVNCLARLLIQRMGRSRRTSRPKVSSSAPQAIPKSESDAGAAVSTSGSRLPGRNRVIDAIMTRILGLAFAVALVPLFIILSYIAYRGVGALSWEFFTRCPVPVGEAGGGLGNALVGSAMLVGLATLFALPFGILGAVYLVEFRNSRLAGAVRFIGELLGGVPSVVVGVFVYALLVLPFGHFSGWAGAFALAVIMLPLVLRTSEEALKLVPASLRLASYALGATQAQTILRVTVPAAMPAIITGVFLGIGRIAGETAPLLLTAFNSKFWPASPGKPTPSLPYYIFDYSRSSYPGLQEQAWAGALVLLAVVMLLNVGIRFLTGRRVVLASRAD